MSRMSTIMICMLLLSGVISLAMSAPVPMRGDVRRCKNPLHPNQPIDCQVLLDSAAALLEAYEESVKEYELEQMEEEARILQIGNPTDDVEYADGMQIPRPGGDEKECKVISTNPLVVKCEDEG